MYRMHHGARKGKLQGQLMNAVHHQARQRDVRCEPMHLMHQP